MTPSSSIKSISFISQPNYEQFLKFNKTKLLNFCEDSVKGPGLRIAHEKLCQFNVIVDFDFDHLVWETPSGDPITTISWSEGGYPWFNDKLDIVLFE